MTNVLIIPTSGLMEFNASAAAGGFSGTLDNAYANAVRLDIANSATLRVLGKNATNNERLVVSGTNGVVLKVRDVSAAGAASASVETPIMSATYVSAGTVSATNYLNLPVLGEGQFVELSGDTMTGKLILSGSNSSTELLNVSGSVTVSGQISSITISAVSARFTDLSATSALAPTISGTSATVSSLSALSSISATGNILTVGQVSSTAEHRGSSGIFTTTVQAPTLSGTSAIVSSLSALSSISATGNVLAVGDMSSTGAHRGSSGIFTTTVQAPTLSGTSATVSSLSALSSISATGNILTVGDMSSTGAHRGSSGIFTTTVQAPTLSGTSATVSSLSALSSVSAPSAFAPTISGTSGRFVDLSATSSLGVTISGTSAIVSSLSALSAISANGSILATGDMSSTGAHRGSSGIFTTTVQAPTLSGTSAIVSSISALSAISANGSILATGDMSSTGAHRGSSGIFTTTVQAPTLSGTSATVSSISALSSVSAPSAFIQNISATNISAVTNVSSGAFSGVSARFTDLSATSSLGANISATNVTGINAKFPNASANNLSVSVVDGGAVSGVASNDLILRSTVGNINLSSGGTIQLNATAVDIPAGDLSVTGNFKATAKSFLIDHPTPNSGYSKLQYACLEGPENGVYVRGRADTKVGVIELPYYWMDLVHADSITVQLTAMSPAQRLYVSKIENNKVYVNDASAVSEVTTFFYTVNGERKDINHLIVEY